MKMKQGHCVHFTGIGNPCCSIGVNYRKHVGGSQMGWALRLPCILETSASLKTLSEEQRAEVEKKITCAYYREPTAKEIADSEHAHKTAIEKLMLTIPLCARIKREHKGQSWQGVEECPVCKGKLHLSHSGVNGHIWGKCETKGCIKWIE